MNKNEIQKVNQTICKKCYSLIDPSDDFCPTCGTKIEKPVSEKKIPTIYLVWFFPLYILIQFLLAALLFETNLEAPMISLIMSLTTLVGIIAILNKQVLIVFKWFKKGKPYLMGLLIFLIMFGVTIIYGLIETAILNGLGIEPVVNANQAEINLWITNNPFLSFIIVVILAPIVEELVFRLSLFESLKRVNVYLAYIVTIGIFAGLHIDFTNFDITEALAIPSYLIGAIAMTIAYHKYGLVASITAHMANNLLSFLLTIFVTNQALFLQ